MQKQAPTPTDQKDRPQEFSPLDQSESNAAGIIGKINSAIPAIYWSCRNGSYHRPCGCMTGCGHIHGDHPLPPGVSPGGGGETVYYSNRREHWCSPYKVRVENGKIVGPA